MNSDAECKSERSEIISADRTKLKLTEADGKRLTHLNIPIYVLHKSKEQTFWPGSLKL